MGVTFKSNRDEFFRKHQALKDFIFGNMALDIEVYLKLDSGMPVDTGGMKSETRHFKSNTNKWRVEIDKEYASYQERGIRRDGTHRVSHYTTAGTSAGFFMRSIMAISKNKANYIAEARNAVGL